MTENRKLAAIRAADGVGYSRLMQEREARTLTASKQRRREILWPTMAQAPRAQDAIYDLEEHEFSYADVRPWS